MLVPPLATPNGSTNGTLNGTGGAPFLTTTGVGADCTAVTCPTSTNCACFSMAAPNGNPVAGAPSPTGQGYTQTDSARRMRGQPGGLLCDLFLGGDDREFDSDGDLRNPGLPG